MTGSSAELLAPADVFPIGAGTQRYGLIDVRAPVEVARGSLPGALNLPILRDEERHLVGIRYKEHGAESAIELGYRLTEEDMPRRVAAWREAATLGPTAVICWRGGLRSELTVRFIGEPRLPRVAGGYKAVRRYLKESAEGRLARSRVVAVTGMTGTGKTCLLREAARISGVLSLDLEGMANHRGSAFGGRGDQPAQQTFENRLHSALVLGSGDTVLLEDESRRIGGVQLPDPVYQALCGAPALVLETSFESRVERIHADYVVAPAREVGVEAAFARLKDATLRLRPRLGWQLTERLLVVLADLRAGEGWREAREFAAFIAPLLTNYYDPLYERAVRRLDREVLLRGGREELREWLERNR